MAAKKNAKRPAPKKRAQKVNEGAEGLDTLEVFENPPKVEVDVYRLNYLEAIEKDHNTRSTAEIAAAEVKNVDDWIRSIEDQIKACAEDLNRLNDQLEAAQMQRRHAVARSIRAM